MKKKTLVEICVDSVESAMAAEEGGADRIELCDNLMEGGTTPSIGSIKLARQKLKNGLHVIIRPRGGDFLYSEIEFEIMRHDIQASKELGVDGIVIGLLLSDGSIDKVRTKELVELARPMTVTFHRAFDVAKDPAASLEILKNIGIERVLTSGQEPSAFEGLETIKSLAQLADGKIIVMACGSLTPRNVRRFVEQSGVMEVHMTAFGQVSSKMQYRNDRVYMGGTLRPPEFDLSVTSKEIVRNVCDQVK